MRRLWMLIICLTPDTLGSIHVNGYLDGAVIVKCKYASLYKSSKKCFYKGRTSDYSQGVKCVVGGKEQMSANGKFTLYDTNEGFFMVLVTQLTKEDEGSHQCVVDKISNKPAFSEVMLNIIPDPCCGQPVIKNFTKGERINMTCAVTEAYKHRHKYLCKLGSTLTCSQLTPTLDIKKRTKYAVFKNKDNSLQVNVTIRNLDKVDAGEYWCGATDINDESYFILMNRVTLLWYDMPSTTSPLTTTSAKKTTSIAKMKMTTRTRERPPTPACTKAFTFPLWAESSTASSTDLPLFTPTPTAMATSLSSPTRTTRSTVKMAMPTTARRRKRLSTPGVFTQPGRLSLPPLASPYSASTSVLLSMTAVAMMLAAVVLSVYFCGRIKREMTGVLCTSNNHGCTESNKEVEDKDTLYEEIKDSIGEIPEATINAVGPVWTIPLPTIPSVYATAQLPRIPPGDQSTYCTVDSPRVPSASQLPTIPPDNSTNCTSDSHTFPSTDPRDALADGLAADDHTYEMVDLSTRPSDDIPDNVPGEDSIYLLLELSTSVPNVPSPSLNELPTNPSNHSNETTDKEPSVQCGKEPSVERYE